MMGIIIGSAYDLALSWQSPSQAPGVSCVYKLKWYKDCYLKGENNTKWFLKSKRRYPGIDEW